MKNIIIGCGISGCTAYLSLRKHPPSSPNLNHEITIYEAYDTNLNTAALDRDDITSDATHSSTLIVGGGLGLFANGFNVLRRLDGDIARDIVRGGYAIAHQDLRSRNGALLVRMGCTANPAKGLDDDENGSESGNEKGVHLLGTSRHSLWASLRRRIPNGDIVTARVEKIFARDDGMNELHFADGRESVEADLVVGADGIKGLTKEALFLGEEAMYKPEYQGLVGVGGFIPSENVKGLVKKGSMNLLLGGNGFFGYFYSNGAPSSPSRDSIYHVSEPGSHLRWWSTYAADECPDPKTIDVDAKDGVVLVGDAAHALPSTSGQGSLQALEDVEAFTLLLSHALREAYRNDSPGVMAHKKAITTAAKYILEAAQRMQNSKRGMGIIAEYMMYCAMWITGCFPRLMSRSVKSVINYNISEEVKAFLERQRE
ncbi:hypothetical protein BDV19DRAFT_379416 [Aspergillus venezuelensis]